LRITLHFAVTIAALAVKRLARLPTHTAVGHSPLLTSAHLCSPLLGHCCDTARSAEVQSYTFDLCNSLDDCSQYVTSMCNEVLTKLEGDAGTIS